MSASPEARVPDRWFRTRARRGSRACDGCGSATAVNDPIVYRRREGRDRADLMCERCARSTPVRPSAGRARLTVWEVALPASTPAARGQQELPDAPEPARGDTIAGGAQPPPEVLASLLRHALTGLDVVRQDLERALEGARLTTARVERVLAQMERT